MATIEILAGDFQPGLARVRFTDEGTAYLRLRVGDAETVVIRLPEDVAGLVDAAEPGIRSHVGIWLARHGLGGLSDLMRQDKETGKSARRVFVLLRHDRRKLIGRADQATFEQLLALTRTSDAAPAAERGPPPIDRTANAKARSNIRRFGEGRPFSEATPKPPMTRLMSRLLQRWL